MPSIDDVTVRGPTAPLGVLRTAQWAHFTVLPLATLGRDDILSRDGVERALYGIVSASASLGYAYAINAIGDRGSDVGRSKNPLAGFEHVPASVTLVTLCAALVAVVATLPLGALSASCAGASLFASTIYSVGPRAKSLPVFGLVANTMIFLPLLFLCMPGTQPGMSLIVATFVGLLVQNQLVHEIADADEDAAGGDRTTGSVLGPVGVRAACVIVAACVGAYVFQGRSATLATLAALVTLALGALVPSVVSDPARARRIHRGVAGLGGATIYLVGIMF